MIKQIEKEREDKKDRQGERERITYIEKERETEDKINREGER